MKKRLLINKTILLALFLFVGGACSSKGSASSNAPKKINPIINSSVADGCGCYLYEKLGKVNHKGLYFWGAVEGYNVFNINGSDVKLRGCKEFGNFSKIGDRRTRSCMHNNKILVLNLTVTDVCKPEDEGCELTKMTGEIIYDGETSSNLNGGCGC